MIRRLLLAFAALAGLAAGEPRLPPDAAALEQLPQAERWLLIEAQEAYGKGRYGAAAIAWEKFGRRFPDSAMWVWAGWRRAEALRLERKQEGAIAALKELAELAPQAPEMPEILLLLADCQAESGLVVEAQTTVRDLLKRFPDSAAATPARLLLDDATVNLAKQAAKPADRLRAERLSVLAPLADRVDSDRRNLKTYEQGLRRLVDLAFEAGELPRVLALVKLVLAAPQARDLGDVAWHAGRNLIWRAWDSGADKLAAETAGVLWTDATSHALERNRLRLDWLLAVRREPQGVAKNLGLEPKALQERIPGDLAELAGAADQAARSLPRTDERRTGLAWLAAAARLAAGQDAAAAEGLPAGLGRGLNRRDAGQWWEQGERAGIEAGRLLAVIARVEDPRERRLAEMDLKAAAARRLRGGPEAERFAAEAVAIAAAFETEDAERQGAYIEIQADLLRQVLRQYDKAIEAYARLNRPPATDFAIAETLSEKGDHAAAASKLSEIAAIHAGKDAGGSALVRLGRLLHRELKDKARAVAVLRQACDEYPETKHYSEAHRYLQSELGVTYTGGGGKRDKR